MSNILLPIQFGGFPQGFCFQTWDQLGLILSNSQKAILPGSTFYNYGDTVPAPEFQTFPWLNSNDMRWYRFDGNWISPNNYSSFDRRWFAGSLTDLVTYDGGDSGAASDRSGPMWVEDETIRGRMPIGPGTIPTSDPAVTVSVGDTTDSNGGSGEQRVTLTDAQGAVGNHVHPFGKIGIGNDTDFITGGTQSIASNNMWSPQVPGSDQNFSTQTTADLITGPVSNTPTPTAPHNNMPPYIGLYLIKPSGRLYYRA